MVIKRCLLCEFFTHSANVLIVENNCARWRSGPAQARRWVIFTDMALTAFTGSRSLDVVVHDDGRGLPEGFSLEKSDRLGLQIVRTLVAAELDGSLGMHESPTGGTDVVLRVPIGRRTRLPQ